MNSVYAIPTKSLSIYLKDFVENSGIDEEFDCNADFIFMGFIRDNFKKLRGKKKFLGLMVYRLQETKKGKVPRLIHVIISKEHRCSKYIYDFLLATEDCLKRGYGMSISIIKKDNRRMQVIARRYGFTLYNEDEEDFFFYRRLTKEELSVR